MVPVKTPAQIAAANQHASYMCGWVDGAKVTAMRSEFDTHANEQIRAAYNRGYSDGRAARRLASKHATQLYGYEPQILRLQGDSD